MVTEYVGKLKREDASLRYKKCPRCSKPKLITEFYRCKCNSDGYDRYCKKHRVIATSSYHSRNKDKQRRWSADNRIRNKIYFSINGRPPKRHPKKRLCPHCGIKRLAVEFPINTLRSSGRESWCKYCRGVRKRFSARRWYNANREYVNLIRDPVRRRRIAASPFLHGKQLELGRLAERRYVQKKLNL